MSNVLQKDPKTAAIFRYIAGQLGKLELRLEELEKQCDVEPPACLRLRKAEPQGENDGTPTQ
ncbi:MAG: hypothetical protein K9M96_01820 [Deltaproteobacteria bacterium]|nr:hypothetical protein [Deltaproteobacteria bacterium]